MSLLILSCGLGITLDSVLQYIILLLQSRVEFSQESMHKWRIVACYHEFSLGGL